MGKRIGGTATWLKGLLAAVLGGALGAAGDVLVTGADLKQARGAAITGAILTTAAYLKRSPLK